MNSKISITTMKQLTLRFQGFPTDILSPSSMMHILFIYKIIVTKLYFYRLQTIFGRLRNVLKLYNSQKRHHIFTIYINKLFVVFAKIFVRRPMNFFFGVLCFYRKVRKCDFHSSLALYDLILDK